MREGNLEMAQEMHIVLKNRDKINPLDINDYLAAGGYQSLVKPGAWPKRSH